ncbi:MAG: carbohydrate-binding domain-containing protein [Bacteroidaceae bacterium]|nr:carbohydrate-binding domain-containing protein [Bacteroidaceae bacterium]
MNWRFLTISIAMAVAAVASQAQTLNVVMGSVTYQFPAMQMGEMAYMGSTVSILGRTFVLGDITKMYIDASAVTDNQVAVTYNGTSAAVTVAGNVAKYIVPTVSGAHVAIAQGNTDDVDGDEIIYVLSGTTTDGEFGLSGLYKCTVQLNGVNLTNPSGAAISISNKKRIQISVKKDTENTLTDGADGSQKACLYSKGQLQLQGNGTLNVYGNTTHAIKSADYVAVKNLTLNVQSAVGDGVNCNRYFLMESGTVSINGTGDDGIQCELDGTESTGETSGHVDEDSGNVYIEDGTLTVNATAVASKGVKATGNIVVSGGAVNITTSGNGTYDSTDKDAKGSAGMSADGDMTISGGTLTLKNTGSGGKCLKADGTLTVSNGTVTATNTGSQYRYNSSYTASAKAIKAGTRTQTGGSGQNATYAYSGGIIVSGGTVTALASSNEAIESKSTIDISGGVVYAYSTDDAINSASTFTISGGYVMGNSTGNDGLDANGNFYIKGGTIFAVAKREPEVGIDANTEASYKLYVSGGTIVAVGGLERGSSLTQSCYQASSYSKGTWYGLYSGSTLMQAFKVPSNSNMGTPLVVSTSGTASLKSGVTVSGGIDIWDGFGKTGASVSGGTSVNLSSYTGGGGGGGGGGPWGPGGGW